MSENNAQKKRGARKPPTATKKPKPVTRFEALHEEAIQQALALSRQFRFDFHGYRGLRSSDR